MFILANVAVNSLLTSLLLLEGNSDEAHFREELPMPVYMIGYDLHPSEGEKYGELYTALEAIGSGGYWDCLNSTGCS